MKSSQAIPDGDLKILLGLFCEVPQLEKVILYGSRAKGTNELRSDIDLVTVGDEVDRHIIAELLGLLVESDIAHIVDISRYEDISNQALLEHIDRVGITIYSGEIKK